MGAQGEFHLVAARDKPHKLCISLGLANWRIEGKEIKEQTTVMC
jgi:hypothetical protein